MKPLLDRQLAYLHGRDLSDCSILWINLAQYRPNDTGFENVFVFWLEHHTMETKGDPLTIVLNMTGTSLKNMDFKIFKFIFHALKYYYPSIVHDIIIFESPSMLSASWKKSSSENAPKDSVKVVKSWLDPSHPQLHHVTKETMSQFVDSRNVPLHMGGEDHFKFTMDDLAKCLPASREDNGQMTTSATEYSFDRNGLDSMIKRAVTFDDDDEEANRKVPLTISRKSSNGSVKRNIPQCLKPVIDARLHSPDTNWVKNAFLKISPRDVLDLSRIDNITDYVDIVVVRNISDVSVMFKIKTTSPEKFRVRPTMGVIPPESTEIIRVYLQSEYKDSCAREKFLLLALESENNNLETFGELWKNASSDKKVEQKLRCRVNDACSGEGHKSDQADKKTDPSSQRAQFILVVAMFVLFLTLMVIVVNERSRYSALEEAVSMFSKKLNTTECEKAPTTQQQRSPPVTYEEDL
uniref:Major sperm protein n=1 Tax=Angiostrongylus cantonensis TaxID=6313 RepID=A0A0K0DMK4_ANGCA